MSAGERELFERWWCERGDSPCLEENRDKDLRLDKHVADELWHCHVLALKQWRQTQHKEICQNPNSSISSFLTLSSKLNFLLFLFCHLYSTFPFSIFEGFHCIFWACLLCDLSLTQEAIRLSTSDFKIWGFFCLQRMRREKQKQSLSNANYPQAHLCLCDDRSWWELPMASSILLHCSCWQGVNNLRPGSCWCRIQHGGAHTRASCISCHMPPVLWVPLHHLPAEPFHGLFLPRCKLLLIPSSLLHAFPLCPKSRKVLTGKFC